MPGYHGSVSDHQDPPGARSPINPLGTPSPAAPPVTPPMSRRETLAAERARVVARADAVERGAAGGEPAPHQPIVNSGFDRPPRVVAPDATAAVAAHADGDARPAAPGGILAAIERNPKAWTISALGMIFVVLATGSIFAGVAVGVGRTSADARQTAGNARSASTPPTARPVPPAIAAATPIRTCSIAGPANDPNLLTLQASVINAATGEVLFDRNGAKPSRTASLLKTLTAAAALSVLGPDYRFSTRVYAGATPGTVALVGGGDPTLSALGAGQESVYRGAPKLSDLAAEVTAKSAVPITGIVLDSNLWNPSDNWDPTWDRSEQSQGFQPEVTALTVDGGRADPRAQDSVRSSTPVADAGAAFAADLGITGSGHVTMGTAPPGATLLGEVKSQPVRTLIAQMLPLSDNALGEYLARQVSKVSGSDGSSASLNRVIPAALTAYGLTTTGLTIRDGSGLSGVNAVPAAFVAQLMTKIAAGGQNPNIISDSLPISGKTGTLAGRFTGSNAVARGAVSAKTGWITTEDSLAGIVHAADGSTLAFAFYALGSINSRTIPALDTLTTAVFTCGSNLANN